MPDRCFSTRVFSFTLFIATTGTVLCNSNKDCLKLEITGINYHGILTNSSGNRGNIRELCLLEMLGTLIYSTKRSSCWPVLLLLVLV